MKEEYMAERKKYVDMSMEKDLSADVLVQMMPAQQFTDRLGGILCAMRLHGRNLSALEAIGSERIIA